MPAIAQPEVVIIPAMEGVTPEAEMPAARSVRSRLSIWIFGLTLIGVGVFYWSIRPEVVLHRGDTVYYLAGAQSLAQGTGYRIPLYEDVPAIGLYPPLQSLFLSFFWSSGTLPNFDIL